MQILFGTPVYASDGEKIGETKEVVIDPRTKTVTYLVVQEGLLFDNDSLVPVDAVKSATEEEVHLTITEKELDERSHEYRAEDFVSATPPDAEADESLSGAYWTNPLDLPVNLIPPGLGRVDLPEDTSIPFDEVMLMHGSAVHTSDGEIIGSVDEVITDDDDKITHLVIEEGVVYALPKLVPLAWIADFSDNQITLNVEKFVVDRLPDYAKKADSE